MYLNKEDHAAHLAAINDNGPIDGASVTYCPEDDKLRLYVGRVPRPVYDALRAFGWNATPKQDCDFAAVWTVYREDMALALLPEGLDIEDEDTPPEERAADRAERFGGYRDKRLGEAIGHADAFDEGPSAVGCQSRQRAERIAARLDRTRGRAVSQWSKAEYWTRRTEGVIDNAIYKSTAHVRRGRLAKLESERRKAGAGIDKTRVARERWRGVIAEADDATAAELAASHASYSVIRIEHPRTAERMALSELLTHHADPVPPRELAALYVERTAWVDDPTRATNRHLAHLDNRLAYERQMLGAQGGSAQEVTIEPGGWIRPGRSFFHGTPLVRDGAWVRVEKVNKSTATGRVSSVGLLCNDKWGNGNDPRQFVAVCSVERLGEDAYRPPTDEERAAFAAEKAAKKTAAKTAKKTAEKAGKTPPPLVNPTDADAERLQAILNAAEGAPSEVCRMTQSQYSAQSGGTYSPCETSSISERLCILSDYDHVNERDGLGRVVCFKVRTGKADYHGGPYPARRVIILTDKPQKPIPWERADAAAAEQPQADDIRPHLPELAGCHAWGGGWRDKWTDEQKRIADGAIYLGWFYVSSLSQFGLTKRGHAELAALQAEAASDVFTLAKEVA